MNRAASSAGSIGGKDASAGNGALSPAVSEHGRVGAPLDPQQSPASPETDVEHGFPPPPSADAIDQVIASAMALANSVPAIPPKPGNTYDSCRSVSGAAHPTLHGGHNLGIASAHVPHHRSITPSGFHPAAVGLDGRVNLFVGNLPYRVRWQDVKDLFRRAGTVLRADVSLDVATNRSRGYGTVLMGSREDGVKAIGERCGDGKKLVHLQTLTCASSVCPLKKCSTATIGRLVRLKSGLTGCRQSMNRNHTSLVRAIRIIHNPLRTSGVREDSRVKDPHCTPCIRCNTPVLLVLGCQVLRECHPSVVIRLRCMPLFRHQEA